MRLLLVTTGKIELAETIDSINLAQFQQAIAGFSSQIRAASDPVLHETMICDFSTTTADVRIASEVVPWIPTPAISIYGFDCVYGIPKVTLSGIVNDRRRIRARI